MESEVEYGDIRSIMLGVIDANWKLDEVLFLLVGGDDEEEEDEADG
jgi:hypothetical protein